MKVTVWTLMIDDRYGACVRVFATKGAGERAMVEYASDNWEREIGGNEPEEPQGLVEAFFHRCNPDTIVVLEEAEVES